MKKKNSGWKNLAFWIFLALLLMFFFQTQTADIGTDVPDEIEYSTFRSLVRSNEVIEVEIRELEKRIIGKRRDNSKVQSYIPYQDPKLIEFLEDNNVTISGKPIEQRNLLFDILISWGPMIVFILFLWFVFYRQIGGSKGAFSFSKSKAKLLNPMSKKITFKDIAGCDEAKKELEEIIEFLKDPKKFQRLGGKIPKGVLIVGPPGTGKTLLAKAVSGEANRPFFSMSGSDFVEMFVGVGASRVRDLFNQSKKHAPCIIFVDEIDAVGRVRGSGLGGGHDEREQTLNQLLVEMDGFETNEGIILIAATNRPDVLDPALLRPGRFDRQVVVDIPDLKGRMGVLKVHTMNIPLESTVNITEIARGTPGFTGADLANLVNEAALLAARNNLEMVTQDMLELARDKILMGPERKSLVINEKEKKVTAYHEVGHALVAELSNDTDPLHKITIIPRGRALGATTQLPKEDKYTLNKSYLLSRIAVLLGGLVTEDIIFGERTNGAANDIERATNIARKMICEWGMSENLGPIQFGKREQSIFLGKQISEDKNYSERTSEMIDEEVKNIITDQYNVAKEILSKNKSLVIKIADVLFERESLTGEEVKAIIRGEELELYNDKMVLLADKIQVARTFLTNKIIFTFSDGIFEPNQVEPIEEADIPVKKIGKYLEKLVIQYNEKKKDISQHKKNRPEQIDDFEKKEKEIFQILKAKVEDQLKEKKVDITLPGYNDLKKEKIHDLRIEIHGFSDSLGEKNENTLLSKKRANVLKNIFVKEYHLPANKIVVFGKADTEEIADNYTPEGRRKNRRIKIIVLIDILDKLEYEDLWTEVMQEFSTNGNNVNGDSEGNSDSDSNDNDKKIADNLNDNNTASNDENTTSNHDEPSNTNESEKAN